MSERHRAGRLTTILDGDLQVAESRCPQPLQGQLVVVGQHASLFSILAMGKGLPKNWQMSEGAPPGAGTRWIVEDLWLRTRE